MRTNKLHAPASVVYVVLLNCLRKKGDKYILAAPALRCSHSMGLNQTKTTNRGRCDTNRFAPCGGHESPVGR